MPTHRQSPRILIFGLLLLLGFVLLVLALTAYVRVSSGSLEETELRGNEIVLALERYHADQNQYPSTLSELSPKYLKTIPAPAWGLRVWQYERRPDGSFYLFVNENENTGDGDSLWFRYLGPKLGWQTGD